MQRTINYLLVCWLACYSALCYANTTLAEDIRQYDWVSLLLAAAAGLVGGAGRTILTLITKGRYVGNVKMLMLKDLVVALFGGGMAYLCIQGWNVATEAITLIHLPAITRDWRVLILVLAGGSRGRWMGVVDRLATDAIANARAKLRGGAPEDPPVVAAPTAGDT